MAGVMLLPVVGPAPQAQADIYYVTGLSLSPIGFGNASLDFSTTPSATLAASYKPSGIFDFGIMTFGYDAAFLSVAKTSPYTLYFAAASDAGAEDAYKYSYGASIGLGSTWELISYYSAYYGDISEGAFWSDGDSGYVGVKIVKAGLSYFGWIAITLDATGYPTVTGFGWESSAGTSISAGAVPEPGAMSLAGLALGAAGLHAWRRKRREEEDAA